MQMEYDLTDQLQLHFGQNLAHRPKFETCGLQQTKSTYLANGMYERQYLKVIW